MTIFGCFRWHYLLLFINLKVKFAIVQKKFGNLKKNIFICKNFDYSRWNFN